MKKRVLKTFALFLVVLIMCAAASCESQSPKDETAIRLGALKGATMIGLVKLLADADAGESSNTYEYTLAGSADELTPLLLQGKIDIAAIPINLASVLYNKSEGALQFAAINTLGVLYITENGDTLENFSDLKGKTIYATGKGSVPEYSLRYLLSANGIDPDEDITLEFRGEPTEVAALMATTENIIAMLPEPFVSVAGSQVDNFRVAFDLTEEWEKLNNGSMLITAGIVVRREFAEQHPEVLAEFLKEYKASAQYANTNPAECAELVENYGIIKAAVAQKAIPNCSIVFIDGEEMKTAADNYLKILFEMNPASVGGSVPDEDFYYVK
ncbi:MAG: ABC transporter substrate-binding protein [Eubacteriaceae bacterium]|nr:ABC transporter substrate-binding protein [Eubacteriaceae bacterium]